MDSSLNVKHTRLLISYVLMSGNVLSYSAPDGISLLCVIRILSEVMMVTASSMFLVA